MSGPIKPFSAEDFSLSRQCVLVRAHVFGQTIELFGVMAAGGAIGLAESPATLLDDIKKVRPTVLVAVPVVFNKIYDKVNDKIKTSGGLAAMAFKLGMQVGL